jgi:hypothetical protein
MLLLFLLIMLALNRNFYKHKKKYEDKVKIRFINILKSDTNEPSGIKGYAYIEVCSNFLTIEFV